MKEIHITLEGTLLVNDHVPEKWYPDEITVEVRAPAPDLANINRWLKNRNKNARVEIVPIEVMVEAYHAMVLANQDTQS